MRLRTIWRARGVVRPAGATEVDTVVGRRTKLGALDLNTAHGYEHYGNMVTYFRLNKMVPPSSQGS